MKIGIDIMGGDFAPNAALDGINQAYQNPPENLELVLLGDQSIIEPYLDEHGLSKDHFKIIHSEEVIEMGESPTKAFSKKPKSSISIGFKLLSEGKIDVFLSAGNTGAMMVGSLYTVKAIEGVLRPSVTTLVPKENGDYGIMLDAGANADCKQDVLYQFGLLGSLYSKYVYKNDNPRVGLLNIGSEEEKGNVETKAAYPMLEASEKINFIGNVEGHDLFKDVADVYVCDGFTGNIVLKSAESIIEIIKQRGIKDEFFKQFDYENYGGTPILGVNKPVMIGHGVSSPTAFKNMIMLSQDIVDARLIEKMKAEFES